MEKKFFLIKMYFNAPLLFSKGIFDYTKTTFHLFSDTIKNALFVEHLQLPNPLPINDFYAQFKISSAFPFYQNYYFFPKPFKNLLLRFTENNTECPEKNIRKKRKKIQWLEKTIFENEINNISTSIDINQLSHNGQFVFPSDAQAFPNLIQEELTPRARHHLTKENEPFEVIRFHFASNAGLFTLIETPDKHFLENTLIPAFKLLAVNGIGGYKTLGFGTFDPNKIIPEQLSLKTPHQPTHLMNLSLFLPTPQEAEYISQTPNAFYSLIKRAGYITSTTDFSLRNFKKKSIFMFLHGSVFPIPQHSSLSGTIAQLNPKNIHSSHPICKDGTSIFIPTLISQ